MIRGLRLTPWLQLAHKRSPDSVAHLYDCQRCMKTIQKPARQAMGCGYEQPPAGRVVPWDHPGRTINADERDEKGRLHLPVCAGYVCSLPEVVETTWAHAFFEKGELGQFCGGQATPQLLEALRWYATEDSRCSIWESQNPEKR